MGGWQEDDDDGGGFAAITEGSLCRVIMYSQEYTSTLTQHIGSAVSDYHIHNSVSMFERPLRAPPPMLGVGFFFLRAVRLPDCDPRGEELEKEKLT